MEVDNDINIDVDIDIVQREQDINAVYNEMLTVNSLFRDVHSLVENQSEQTENILWNIQNASSDVEAARGQLTIAADNQPSYCIVL